MYIELKSNIQFLYIDRDMDIHRYIYIDIYVRHVHTCILHTFSRDKYIHVNVYIYYISLYLKIYICVYIEKNLYMYIEIDIYT